MCGICGAVWTDPAKAIDRPTLDTMTDRLRHRGPDDRGTFWQPFDSDFSGGIGVALGHRRLSILDLSPNGRQPMSSDDGAVQLVFNGEIYNFEPLRREFVSKGRRFRGDSDTEVLLRLYEEEGAEMVHRLNGMFALAIWDGRRRRLLLLRDRIGKKPLFYWAEPNRIVFASELKSILAVPDVPREIDPTALDDYLTYQYVPHPKTIFKNISKLPPGHLAEWRDGRFSVSRYWNPDLNEEDDRLSFEDWSEQLRELVTDAVRIRMRSDVPIGAFLSGGVDSTITAGVMQRESSQPIRTFSIGFSQREYDETDFARQSAERFGTIHREFTVTPNVDALWQTLLPKLVWHYDEPFADSSAIPTWYLCKMTRQDVTVALSGDGGDEMFAGYDRYRAVRLGGYAERLPMSLRRLLAGPLRSLIPASTRQRSTLRRVKRFLEALGMEPLERYLQWIAIFNRQRRQELYTDDFRQCIAGHDSLDFLRAAQNRCAKRDRVTATALVDMQTYLPCDIMTKVDIASMAHSLECRAPLLDYRIAEWSAKMPIRFKTDGRLGKIILRETFRDLLPPDIDRRPKRGFGVPIDHWFRGPLKNTVRDVLLDSRTVSRGLFRRESVQQILDDHFANRFDHAYRIWALFFLELWMRQWVDDGNVTKAGMEAYSP